VWLPADTYDQWARIPLTTALRNEKVTPYRGAHAGVARGCLSERIRTVYHDRRLLVVDKDRARLTLNSLSAGYALPGERGGRHGQEPEHGTSRLIAEALECMVSMLDKTLAQDASFPRDAHIDHTHSGIPFMTTRPIR
jgi:hypothetical protein